MQITFYKYQGAGNDFICIDDLAGTFPGDDHERIRRICDRHFGVGADGLILLRPSGRNHFAMVYYNANASPRKHVRQRGKVPARICTGSRICHGGGEDRL
ncbi:MAG: hypothetical protein U5N26_01390 [Candidatus Marinimicrobia bacterium]|nr:hypothetical protein [Candidatus Neomarinimicrobiota bacterium]